jgi:hypothetical protein
MLCTIGNPSGGAPFDYAGAYRSSPLWRENLSRIDAFVGSASDANVITFTNKYATDKKTQIHFLTKRITLIYWRSPSYNFVRMAMAILLALLFGKSAKNAGLILLLIVLFLSQGVCTPTNKHRPMKAI